MTVFLGLSPRCQAPPKIGSQFWGARHLEHPVAFQGARHPEPSGIMRIFYFRGVFLGAWHLARFFSGLRCQAPQGFGSGLRESLPCKCDSVLLY